MGVEADRGRATAVNLANWEARVRPHAVSAEYALHRYAEDPEHLSDVVRFDLPRLGDVAGLDLVHLQCHLGTDTVSLARLGANVTGLDFSPSALEVARDLATSAGVDVAFVEGDVSRADEVLPTASFDVVYTGIGALCWIPDIDRWAQIVAGLLRPGGRLFLREGHPVLWAVDEPRPDGLLVLAYPYSGSIPVRWTAEETYVRHDEPLEVTETVEFNHGIGQILTALLDAGMVIDAFEEHDSVPWAALGDQMEELPGGEFRLRQGPERLPHSYTLRAHRAADQRHVRTASS